MTPRTAVRSVLAAGWLLAAASPGTVLAQWQANGVPAAPGLYLQSAPVAVTDGAGGVIVAWGESFYHQGAYVQRIDATGHVQWGANGVQITSVYQGDLTPADDIALLPDGSGGAFVVYEVEGADLLPDLYTRHVQSSGTLDPGWPAGGVPLCTAVLDQIHPVICTDGLGGFIAAWLDGRGGSNFATQYDIYAQRVNAAGAVQWAANGVVAAATPGRQQKPEIVSDGSQGAILTWDDSSPKIYAQRIDGTGARQWVLPARVLCDSLGPSRDGTRIVTDGSGGAIVTWGDDVRPGNPNSPDIAAQHVTQAGMISWGAGGTRLVDGQFAKTPPVPVADGAGGVFLFWADQRNGTNWDVFAKHVTSAGATAPGWLSVGLAVGHARGAAPWMSAGLDGFGGALVAWDNFDANGQGADSTADIFVGRVTGPGAIAPNWPATGLQVTNASQNQAWPALVVDGAGAGTVAWEDARLRTPFPAEAYDLVYVAKLGAGGGVVDVPGLPVGPGTSGLGIRLAANPCAGEVDADFESPRSGPARLGLYDVRGRLLEAHAAQAVAGRAFRVEFDATHVLPPGLYFVRFAQGEEVVAARVALVR